MEFILLFLDWFQFCTKFFFAKKVSSKFSVLKIYNFGSILLGVSTLLYPICGVFLWTMGKTPLSQALTWVLLIMVTSGNSVGFMTCLPVITGMISNATDPERQGLVMGTSQSCSSGLRSFGPVASGILISAFTAMKTPYLFFVLFSIGYFACCYVTRRFTPADLIRISERTLEVELLPTENTSQNEEKDTLLTRSLDKPNKI